MAVPQLVPMDVRSSGSPPFPTDISDCLTAEVSLSARTREYMSLSFASAQAFEYSQRAASNVDHSLLGSAAEQVNLFSVIESLDVHLRLTGDLKDPATKTA
jgi:hypothetical protein